MDAFVGHRGLPVTQMLVELAQASEDAPFQSVCLHISHTALHLALVLRRVGPARQHAHPIVPAKLSQLRVDLRVIPVGFGHRCLQVVYIQGQWHSSKAADRVLQHPQERLRILTQHRLAVPFARMAQHHAKHPGSGTLALLINNGCPKTEIHLRFFARVTLDAPHSGRVLGLELAHIALHRLVGVLEPVLAQQILVNALSAQSCLELSLHNRTKWFAQALAPGLWFSRSSPLAALPILATGAGGRNTGTL